MKTIKNIFLLILIPGFILLSCSKVQEPFYTFKKVLIDSTNHRSVLIEDYTGMKCPNCPDATKIADGLQEIYQGQVYVVQVHAGHFADPEPEIYTTDYRCATGDAWYTDFVCPQNPIGLINRTTFKTKFWLNKDFWPDAVAYQAGLPKAAILSVHSTVTVKEGKNQLTANIQGKFLKKLSGSYNLCVCILEDSLISAQDVKGVVNYNYVFMNVLRGSISGTYGEQVAVSADSLTQFSRSYTYPLKADWKVKNLNLLAFLLNPDNREIVHVVKKRVLK
jgi:hypothetical protein